jgi:hypothetical protein
MGLISRRESQVHTLSPFTLNRTFPPCLFPLTVALLYYHFLHRPTPLLAPRHTPRDGQTLVIGLPRLHLLPPLASPLLRISGQGRNPIATTNQIHRKYRWSHPTEPALFSAPLLATLPHPFSFFSLPSSSFLDITSHLYSSFVLFSLILLSIVVFEV